MRVAIIQSSYIPWRGYFDIVDDVDLFVYYDDVQYTRRDWRNRNKIKTTNGLIWLTVTVHHESQTQRICDTRINYSSGWSEDHIRQLRNWYKKAPYFSHYFDQLVELLSRQYRSISELNQALGAWVMAQLDIETRVLCSTSLGAQGRQSDRLLDVLARVGATTYVSGPSASSYINSEQFRRQGIQLEYKTYDYDPYPQLYGPFDGAVSVLDLLFNVGPNARRFLKSRSPNRIA